MWSFFTKVYKRIINKVTLTTRNMNSTKSSGMRNATGTRPQQNDTSAAEEHSHEDAEYAVVRREWADRHWSAWESVNFRTMTSTNEWNHGSSEVVSRPLGGPALGGASLNLQRWYHEPNGHQPYNAVGAVRMLANGVADDGSGLCGSVQTSRASRRIEPDKEAKG